MEIDHAIGYNGDLSHSLLLHSNNTNYLYISGPNVIISNLSDTHQQTFLKAHDDQITCIAISHNGKLIASCILKRSER